MSQHYHGGLVLLSLAVAILASYTALMLATRIGVASRQTAPAWLLGGGVAMGTGIWSMHFVGMLALSLPIEIAYDLAPTALSLVIAIAVSTYALHIASRRTVGTTPLVIAGVAMGTGIFSMHYVGMAAIVISPPIRYDLAWVALSFCIAIGASFGAFGVAFGSGKRPRWRHGLAAGAIGMGVAITGMHYAGMMAAQFPAAATGSVGTLVDRAWLAGAVTVVTLVILLGTLLLLLMEARTTRIEASLAEAEQSSRAKDAFLAMLGHELRNPLASITNASLLLDRTAPRSAEHEFARAVIARQSSHLAGLVDDLLEVGHAVAGKLSVRPELLELRGAVGQALAALEAAGRTAGRVIEFNGSTIWVLADRTRVEQVVTNLISNAVKHTADGGRVRLEVGADAEGAVLTVADDGIGMDAETAARAFELFFQGPQDPDRKRGGLGIGLTLVRRIVQLHGGTIAVSSDGPGRGSTFTVRLPRALAPKVAPPVHAAAAVARGRCVVVVDDQDDVRATLSRLLESEGHAVHAASDGPGAVEAILRVQPDIALIDIGLPGLDGYQVARRVRAAGLATRLVAVTGYGQPEDRQRASDAGFDAHFTKPVAAAQILSLVAEAAER